MKKLIVTSKNGYLDLPDLPHNCIFNKVVTGCGGTTIVLFNNENYVIAVPTTELITNKTGLTSAGTSVITSPIDGKEVKVFGLFGEFNNLVKKDFTDYVNESGIKKIICTYDKLSKLSEFLNPTNYRLLVDEYHILLKAYGYRKNAINGVLNSFRDYKSFCFMSATPISSDFKPTSLGNIDEFEADWNDNKETLFARLIRTNKPYIKTANIIKAYQRDGYITVGNLKSYEAFFFINSVNDIAAILKHCSLKDEEVRIICADTDDNREKLKGYTISNSKAPNKKFNFITSKSFEGADYESETGLCFVVSNSRNKHTLLDISTDIYQIAGRIRTTTNPFRKMLIHIFNTTGKRNIDLETKYEDIVEKINKDIKAANLMIEVANNNPDADVSKFFNAEYIIKDETGKYFIDEFLIKLELYTFKVEQSIYKNGISIVKNYKQNGVVTTNTGYEKLDDTMSKGAKIPFKEAFLKYSNLTNQPFSYPALKAIVDVQPLVRDAYNKLGVKKVKQLRYSKKSVEAALVALEQNSNIDTRIAKILNVYITVGFNNTDKIKSALAEAYKLEGINKAVKATDITTYFEAESKTKKIDGKTQRGFEIIRGKFIFN